ncbi:MAG: DUF5694 domain-containing protein [Saprospiraceae bacterium]
MKSSLLITGLILFINITSFAQLVKDRINIEPKTKVKVMILGMSHFGNPNQDVVNLQMDDVLAEKRQKEIQAVTDKLAKFKPTKIALEIQPEQQNKVDQNYKDYKNGKYQLRRNEAEQIGYRLAKQLDLPRVHCVDATNHWFFDSLMTYAAQHGQAQMMQNAFAPVMQMVQEEEAYLRTHTIGEHLLKLNDPKQILKSNAFYLSSFPKVGEGESYIGTELVADWYKRNMKIYTNVLRFAEEGDRILIIFGQGHARLLRHFFEDTFDFEIVEVTDYLK